jgi:hypothetical protein
VKLWHDDIRRPPDDAWIWARTNEDAKAALIAHRIEECSLDHDLGLHLADPDAQDADLQRGWDVENDGVTLIQWMVQHAQYMPQRITIHSWNPQGAARMAALLADHGYPCVVKPYERRAA